MKIESDKNRNKSTDSRHWKTTAFVALTLLLAAVCYIGYMLYIKESSKTRLLSTRIYNNILRPGELLIFNYEPLEKKLRSIITDKNMNKVGVYIQNMRDGVSLGINEEMEFEPASLNKIPMAIIVLHMVETGAFNLDTRFQVHDSDLDNKSGTRPLRPGSSYSVKELLLAMLADSDNTSYRVFKRIVDVKKLAFLAQYINYYSSRNGQPEKNQDLILTTTPVANSRIFWSLYLSSILEKEHSELILSKLLKSTFDIYKLADIPRTDRVAHKFAALYTGNEKYFHDCGILYTEFSRVFYCIMTKNLDQPAAEELTGSLLHELHKYFADFNKRSRSR